MMLIMFIIVAIKSQMPDVSIPVMPITDFVFQDMKNFGNRPALVSEHCFSCIAKAFHLFKFFI